LIEEIEMRRINKVGKSATSILFILTVMVSCSTIPILKVTYRLPSKSDEWKGKKLFLAFEDIRKDKNIIGKGARADFENFSGNILFFLAHGNEPGARRGAYEVPYLFMEAFRIRLENSGAEVVSEKAGVQLEVVIELKDFLLDLQDGNWVVSMGYNASLVRHGKVLSRQTITGQGERLKLVGRGQADIVVGEIITDTVNRFDLGRLFQQADL